MLLWTTVGLTVVGFLLYLIGSKTHNYTVKEAGGGMTAIFVVILALMLISLVSLNVGNDGDLAKKQKQQEFLTVQYRTGVYDDSVYSQYNLLQKIDDWNCQLARMQKLTHNYWIGIFIPDYWDELDYITVNLFEDVTTGRT